MKRNVYVLLIILPFLGLYFMIYFHFKITMPIILKFILYSLAVVILRDKYVGNKIKGANFFSWTSRKTRIIKRFTRP